MASLTRQKRKEYGELFYTNLSIRKEIIQRDEAVNNKKNELNNLKSAKSPELQLKPSGGPQNKLKLDGNKKQVLKDVYDIQKNHNQKIEKVVRDDLAKENDELNKLSSLDIQELLDNEIITDNAHKPNGLHTNKEINDFLEREGFEPNKDEIKQTKDQEIEQNKKDMLNDLEHQWKQRERDYRPQKEIEFDKNKDDIDPELNR